MQFPEYVYILDGSDEPAGMIRITNADAPLPWAPGVNFALKPDGGVVTSDADSASNAIYWGDWGDSALRFVESAVVPRLTGRAFELFLTWARSQPGRETLHARLGDVVVVKDGEDEALVHTAELGLVSAVLFVNTSRMEGEGAIVLRQLAPERPTFRQVVDQFRWLTQVLAAHSNEPTPTHTEPG